MYSWSFFYNQRAKLAAKSVAIWEINCSFSKIDHKTVLKDSLTPWFATCCHHYRKYVFSKCTWGWQNLFPFCVKIHLKVIKKKPTSGNMPVINQPNNFQKTFLINFFWCYLGVYKSINASWLAIAQIINHYVMKANNKIY